MTAATASCDTVVDVLPLWILLLSRQEQARQKAAAITIQSFWRAVRARHLTTIQRALFKIRQIQGGASKGEYLAPLPTENYRFSPFTHLFRVHVSPCLPGTRGHYPPCPDSLGSRCRLTSHRTPSSLAWKHEINTCYFSEGLKQTSPTALNLFCADLA